MQYKLEVLMLMVNKVEERVSDIEDKLMARREVEEEREKQLKDHEDRLREINDSPRRKNLRIIGVQRTPRGREGQKAYLNKS